MEELKNQQNIPYYPKILVTVDETDNVEFATVLRIRKGGLWYKKKVINQSKDHFGSFSDCDFHALCYKMILLGENLIENGDEPAEDQRSELRRLAEEEEKENGK